MTGSERRQKLLQLLSGTQTPISGASLAKHFTVSRQVIVQDMALLRAQRMQILSTYKGYFLDAAVKEQYVRIFRVHHDTEHTLDELQLIVDYGGKVLDVFVEHPPVRTDTGRPNDRQPYGSKAICGADGGS